MIQFSGGGADCHVHHFPPEVPRQATDPCSRNRCGTIRGTHNNAVIGEITWAHGDSGHRQRISGVPFISKVDFETGGRPE